MSSQNSNTSEQVSSSYLSARWAIDLTDYALQQFYIISPFDGPRTPKRTPMACQFCRGKWPFVVLQVHGTMYWPLFFITRSKIEVRWNEALVRELWPARIPMHLRSCLRVSWQSEYLKITTIPTVENTGPIPNLHKVFCFGYQWLFSRPTLCINIILFFFYYSQY